MQKKITFLVFGLLLLNLNTFSQELLSAYDLFNQLSETFKTTIKDYEADLEWIQKDITQTGKVFFKNPQKLRINFSEPKDQVICSDGYELTVYLSELNLVLKQ
ncbi:MAG: outer-membrane lipoprotein carrier protein LolA, partial [Spirochaetes bacterium]|nr:outer-membrane lipoprotein carrier protein LolA [Spirochaetota bacterium]